MNRRQREELNEADLSALDEEGAEGAEQSEEVEEEEEETAEGGVEDAEAALAAEAEAMTPPREPVKPVKKRAPRRDIGKTHAKPSAEWQTPIDADQRWPEVLDRARKMGKGPWSFVIRATRTQPFAAMPGQIDGSAIAGNPEMSPGDMLREAIIDYYHMPLARNATTYDILFAWKDTGRVYSRGRIALPSPEEIMAFRRVKNQLDANRAPPPGAGAPPSPPWGAPQAAPPAWAPPMASPGGFGAAPPTGAGGSEVEQLRVALAQSQAFQQTMLDEIIRAGREGRAPNIQAPIGVGAPPPMSPPVAPQGAAFSEDTLTRVVTRVLEGMGIRPGVGATAAAAAVAPAAPRTVAEQGAEALESFRSMVGQVTTMRTLVKTLGQAFGAAEYEDEREREPEPAPVVEPPKPEDDLPFQVIPVPEATLFGKPVSYAVDKDTGHVSTEGLAFANPQVAEKLFELGSNLVGGLGRLAKTIAEAPQQPGVGRPRAAARQAPAQVVDEIPSDAVDATAAANGAASGWPT